jgi:F-type H+-transporting ATPase subunit delta
MKRQTRAALRYARALIELVESDADLDGIDAELTTFTTWLMGAPEVLAFARSRAVDAHKRHDALDPAFEAVSSDLLTRFLKLLVDADRLPLLPVIVTTFHELSIERQGRAEAVVTSAVPLDSDQQKRMADALSKRIKKDVRLKLEVDPNVLGGVRVNVGNLLLDGTVRTALSELTAAITAR